MKITMPPAVAAKPPKRAEVVSDPSPVAEWEEIPLHMIEPHPLNPRGDWENQDLQEMVPSIQEMGVLQPILVRPVDSPAGRRFQLIAGERRFCASQLAKRKTIPARVRNLSDSEVLAMMLVENLQRKSLNPIEKAALLERLCQPIEQGGAGRTQVAAAKLFGKKASWASNLLRLLKLPEEWRNKIIGGELSETQGRLLVTHCEQPDVLKAVGDDMRKNPWAWKMREDFERSLKIVVSGKPVPATAAVHAPCSPILSATERRRRHDRRPGRNRFPGNVPPSDDRRSARRPGRRRAPGCVGVRRRRLVRLDPQARFVGRIGQGRSGDRRSTASAGGEIRKSETNSAWEMIWRCLRDSGGYLGEK
ncbi:MAG: ParB/RepB/Spo0J family partition protein [Pirellulales bacterium]